MTTDPTLTIDAHELKQAVTTLAPATEGSAVLPILAAIRFEPLGGQVRLTATNLELTLSTLVESHGQLIGRPFAVPAKALAQMLASVKPATPSTKAPNLTIRADDEDVVIDHGTRRRTIPVLPVDEFPRLADTFPLGGLAIDTAVLADVVKAASADPIRPVLNAVSIQPSGVAAATDAYTAGQMDLANSDDGRKAFELLGEQFPTGMLIPRPAVMALLDLGGEPLLHWNEGCRSAQFAWGTGLTLTARLVEAEFPNYRQHFPTSITARIVFDDIEDARREIAALIPSAPKVKRSKKRAGFEGDWNATLKVAPHENGIALSVRMPDGGTDERLVDGHYVSVDGAEVKPIAYNPAYLLKVLDGLKGPGITVGVADLHKPSLVTEGPRSRILMPVRLS